VGHLAGVLVGQWAGCSLAGQWVETRWARGAEAWWHGSWAGWQACGVEAWLVIWFFCMQELLHLVLHLWYSYTHLIFCPDSTIHFKTSICLFFHNFHFLPHIFYMLLSFSSKS
jgi:hypothetical protein